MTARAPGTSAEPSPHPAAEAGEKWTEYLPLDEIEPADRNPKGHDIPGIRRSLREFGFVGHGSIDERTGRLVIGHGRRLALIEMHAEGQDPPRHIRVLDDGRWAMPIDRGWASDSDDQAEALLVADNMWTERGGWDTRALAEMLERLQAVHLHEAAGFTSEQVEDILGSLGAPPSLDELEAEHGETSDEELWPVIRVKVPPDKRRQFYEVTDDAGAEDDTARFLYLLRLVDEEA